MNHYYSNFPKHIVVCSPLFILTTSEAVFSVVWDKKNILFMVFERMSLHPSMLA